MKLETIAIETPVAAGRFDLQPVRTSDVGLIVFYAGDERVARQTTSVPHSMPSGTADAFITRVMDPSHAEDVWVMDGTRTDGAEVMGLIGLTRIERDQSEIRFWVAPAYWNAGVASLAVEAILRANPQDAKTIFASVFQDNPASARVLTDCGFQYLRNAESFFIACNATVPTWTYTRLCRHA